MVDFKKYSQKDRIAFAVGLLESVYDDFLHEQYEDGLLQDAVICQIYVNRIVFDLNEIQQKLENNDRR